MTWQARAEQQPLHPQEAEHKQKRQNSVNQVTRQKLCAIGTSDAEQRLDHDWLGGTLVAEGNL